VYAQAGYSLTATVAPSNLCIRAATERVTFAIPESFNFATTVVTITVHIPATIINRRLLLQVPSNSNERCNWDMYLNNPTTSEYQLYPTTSYDEGSHTIGANLTSDMQDYVYTTAGDSTPRLSANAMQSCYQQSAIGSAATTVQSSWPTWAVFVLISGFVVLGIAAYLFWIIQRDICTAVSIPTAAEAHAPTRGVNEQPKASNSHPGYRYTAVHRTRHTPACTAVTIDTYTLPQMNSVNTQRFDHRQANLHPHC
jgi:hypothetical protein